MNVQLVSIGDEVLNGQVLNTNTHWLANELTARGYYVQQMITIADSYDAIYQFINDAFEKYDVTIVTGGLGPTKDDITKKVFADYFQVGFKSDQESLTRIYDIFKSRGGEMLDVNIRQADVPEVATVLQNKYGTAPGMLFEKNNRLIIALPGVPFEMKGIMQDFGFEYLQNHFHTAEYYSKSVLLTGIGESYLAERIKLWEDTLRSEGFELAYLPSVEQIKLRITSKESSQAKINRIEELITQLRSLVPEYFFGYEGQTLSGVIGSMLLERNLTISTMESCTGGGILNELIKTSGSSHYVKGGLVTYTNEIKINIGDVSPEIINTYTELSEECAREMAKNVAIKMNTSIGVSITGLLESNELTFAYIGVHYQGKTNIIYKKFGKNREHNIQKSIFAALNFLRNILLEK